MRSRVERRAGRRAGSDVPPGTVTGPALPRSARSKIVSVIYRMSITLGVVLIIAVTAVLLLQHELGQVDREIVPATGVNREVREDLADSQAALERFLLLDDPTARPAHDDAQRRLEASWSRLDALVADDPELRDAVGRERVLAGTWDRDHADRLIAVRAAGGTPTAAAQVAADVAFDQVRGANAEVATLLRAQHQSLTKRAIAVLWTALGIAVLVIAAGLAWTLRPAVRALRWIGPPLEALHATVRKLQGGDLSARADPDHGVLEIRAVSAAVNRLAGAHQERVAHDAEEIRLAEVVREIGAIVGDTFVLDEILSDSTEPIVRHFAAAGVWMRAFEAPAEVEPDSYGSVFPTRSSPQRLVNVVRLAAERAWFRRTSFVLHRDGPNDPDYLSEADAQQVLTIPDLDGAESILVVPLGGGRTCVGYVALRRLPGQPDWSGLEAAALQRVGGDIGRAILHARIYDQERRLVVQLQELDSAKTDFVSMVSHELRTPLASIIGHLEIVQGGDAGPVDDETKPFLAAIDRNATRLSTLIEDLLLLSRIEQRAAHATRTQVDLADTAANVVAMYGETAGRKNITIALDAVEHAPVMGDPTELEHVITNLLGNAIKYSPADTVVTMTLRMTEPADADRGPQPGRELILTVTDQGIGIAPEDQARIFERFYRASSAVTLQVPGTGLGLAITRLVVLRHGGTVTVESAVGEGSRFVVTLPVEVDARVVATATVL